MTEHELSLARQVTDHDRLWMDHALRLAQEAAAMGEVPVGAVVYETSTGKALGEGANRREIDADPAAHAELIAIRRAAEALGDWRLNHCTLVVTLEPCAMCAGLIVNARVGRVVFGAWDPKAGACGSVISLLDQPKLNHRPIVVGNDRLDEADRIGARESGALLREFFRQRRASRPGHDEPADGPGDA